ARTSL
ncbi:Protein of unknown function, partial [Gryllus bimaculatus]